MFELDNSTNHQSSFRMSQYSMIQETVTIITARYPMSSHGPVLVVVFHFVVGWLTLVVFESAFVVSEKYNQNENRTGYWV